jgi:hypothetical protein
MKWLLNEEAADVEVAVFGMWFIVHMLADRSPLGQH